MKVQGEAYFCMMAYIHFLCLAAAKKRLQLPLAPSRALLSCVFSSVYSLLALLPGLPFYHPLLMVSCVFCSSILAFGRHGSAAFLSQLMAGLLFAGTCAFLQKQGLGAVPCLAACTGLCLMFHPPKSVEKTVLRLTWRGKSCRIPVLRDTGNTLHHPALKLPVIVCGENQLRPLLPEGFSTDPDQLLPGWMLISAATVNGRALLPCFVPDRIRDIRSGREICACVAVSPTALKAGLLPGCIQVKEERTWKRTVFSQKEIPPSVNG